jgi:hypothetical protein
VIFCDGTVKFIATICRWWVISKAETITSQLSPGLSSTMPAVSVNAQWMTNESGSQQSFYASLKGEFSRGHGSLSTKI